MIEPSYPTEKEKDRVRTTVKKLFLKKFYLISI